MFRLASCVLILTAVAEQAVANPTVSLSSPNNLNQLSVGNNVEIDVTLSGLPVNDFIFVLNTKVLFPSSSFLPVPDLNNSSGLTPGPILFLPSQVSNFNAASSLLPGVATGNFSDLSPSPSAAISQNGLYYSFTLKAISVGSGSIQFDTPGTTYAANDTGFNLAPLPHGGPLAFTIAAAAVPEPSALVMAGAGVVMTGLGFGWRRRKRTTA
jgi:hypothetical protein